MAEKKVSTKKAATEAATEKKACATKKTCAKKTVVFNAESAGFKAGDVYQALASEEGALTVAQIAKAAKIANEEALIGMGWLFKEGKIKEEGGKYTLA